MDNPKILIIGHGGITPALRQAILMAAQTHIDISIMQEGDLTEEVVKALAAEYNVTVDIQQSLEGFKVMNSDEMLSMVREFALVDNIPTVLNFPNFSKETKRRKQNERPYDKIPPKKLKK